MGGVEGEGGGGGEGVEEEKGVFCRFVDKGVGDVGGGGGGEHLDGVYVMSVDRYGVIAVGGRSGVSVLG